MKPEEQTITKNIVKTIATDFVKFADHAGLKGKLRNDALIVWFNASFTAVSTIDGQEDAADILNKAAAELTETGYEGLVKYLV